MGLLGATLLAELSRPNAAWAPLLEIDGSDGTTIRYTSLRQSGEGAVSSKSLGMYEARVEEWGRFGRRIVDPDGAITSPTARLVLDDRDGGVTRQMPYIFRRPARIKIASPHVAASVYFTLFTGIVYAISQGPEKWTIGIRQEDLWLDAEYPRRRFTANNWPNADKRILNLPEPIVYGRFDRNGLGGGRGMVPAYRVDSSGARYCIAGHICKAVPRVFVGTTLQTLTTHYTITYPVVNGYQYTLIDFVTDPGADAVVTCDVDGAESTGVGTGGSLVTNPTPIWRLLFSNWIVGDYRSGLYEDLTPLWDDNLDDAPFSFFNDYGHQASVWLGGALETGSALFQRYCNEFGLMPFWTNAGKLAAIPFDHRQQNDDVYPSLWINANEQDQARSMGLDVNDEAYVSNLRLGHAFSPADGLFLGSTTVEDAGSVDRGQVPLDLKWHPAQSGFISQARDLGCRRINRFRNLVGRVKVTGPIRRIDLELGTDVAVSWDRGWVPGDDPGWGEEKWERRACRVIGTTLDLDTGLVELELEGLSLPLTSFHHSGKSNVTAVSGAEEGLFTMSVAVARTVTRASLKWAEDPSGYVVQQANATLPVTKHGLMIESAITNQILRSSFVSGFTGVTLFNQGGGGQGTIALDAGDFLILDANGTGINSAKFTAATPAQATNMALSVDTGSLAGASAVSVSIDFKNDSGGDLYWRLQRLVDNFTWDESTHAWTASIINNPLVGTTTPKRFRVGNNADDPDNGSWPAINIGGGGGVLRLFVLQLAGATLDGQVDHVYHMQIEVKDYWGSRKVSDGSAFAGAADVLSWPNDGADGKKTFPVKRGTVRATVRPNFDRGNDLASATWSVWHIQYSATHRFELRYNGSVSPRRWEFRVVVGGSTFTAFVDDDPIDEGQSGLERELIARWTSSEGELGLAPGTASIFIRRQGSFITKGTDATFGTGPTEAAGATFYLGSNNGSTDHFDGVISNVRISPFVIPDSAIGYVAPD